MAVNRNKRATAPKRPKAAAGNMPAGQASDKIANATTVIQRVQTGVRLETRLLKVMKAVAEYHDISLGDLIEGVMLHVFEGRAPFGKPTLGHIKALRDVYGLTLTAADAHRLEERA
jgi:hypothetical protein